MNPARSQVSVIVPFYNAAAFLRAALESALTQSSPPLEVIAVDDGSTDDGAAIAAQFAGVNVLAQAHRGVASARNAGLAAARGEFVAFLDADDMWLPNKLVRQIEFHASNSTLDFSLTHQRYLLEPGAQLPAHIRADELEREEAAFGCGSMMARRSAFERVGDFNTSLAVGEDLDWMIRASEAGLRFGVVDEALLLRRIHGANTSRRASVDVRQLFLASAARRVALARRPIEAPKPYVQ